MSEHLIPVNCDHELITGIKVTTASRQEILDRILASAQSTADRLTVACANAHSLVVAARDNQFATALNSFDIVLPDGISVVWASALLKGKIKAKVAGPEIFEALSQLANAQRGVSYFFLGSSPYVLNLIAKELAKRFPQISLSGVFSPSFGAMSPTEIDQIVESINRSGASVVWIGITAPKQELLCHALRGRLNAPVVACVGAAFDYFAGTKRRPRWAVEHGLGWAYRLLSEPRRLWHRYLFSSPAFIYLVARQRLTGFRKS